MVSPRIILLANAALAALSITDPSDVINPDLWAADNALTSDYTVPFLASQPSDLQATYTFDANSTSFDHTSFSGTRNDTSVISVKDGAELNLSFVDIHKSGYSSNLITASFWGFNAAVNVANASTAHLDNVNITVHNGAANVYVYGTDSVVYVENSWLYSSGPVSHGVYASGNGTAYVSNVQAFSGGMRSSIFSGDNPAGYIYVTDSVAHTAGVGSAIFYALGEIHATNVFGHAENAPALFMDSNQQAYLTNCELTAGLLGGVAIFSSAERTSGAILSLKDTSITTVGSSIPGLWFGNTIIDVSLYKSQLITESGVLIVANFSQITQDFSYYGGYVDNNSMKPSIVTVNVAESALVGDIVAYNSSSINWSLTSHSSWTGAAYSGFGDAYFNIYLDKSSNWTLTKATTVQNFTNADTTLSNVNSQGFNLYYNASATLNGYLGGKTINLAGGGKAIPS